MIIRRKVEHGFTSLPRAAFEDTRLSYEARGMLAYILVKPDDWTVRVTDLARQAGPKGCGRDRVYRMLDELKAAGYMTFSQGRDATGKLAAGEYVVTDTPADVSEKPDTKKPDTAQPDTENTGAYQILSITKDEELPRTESPSMLKGSMDGAAAGQTPGGDEPPSARSKPRRKDAPRTPISLGQGSTIYRDVVHLTPNAAQRELLDAAFERHGERHMRDSLARWLAHGWNPRNVLGMVDHMDGGGDRARAAEARDAKLLAAVIL